MSFFFEPGPHLLCLPDDELEVFVLLELATLRHTKPEAALVSPTELQTSSRFAMSQSQSFCTLLSWLAGQEQCTLLIMTPLEFGADITSTEAEVSEPAADGGGVERQGSSQSVAE